MTNLTITGIRCNGYGQSCGGVNQEYYDVSYGDFFYWYSVGGHTYKTSASWNDGESGERAYRTSPLVA